MKQNPGFIGVRAFTLLLLAVIGLFAQSDGPSKPQDYVTMGRDRFVSGDYKQASVDFERAFALDPSSAECALWLGRSYGRRAEISSPFTAAKYASKARAYFEKAVALDPSNENALNDLFDYYLESPGFGGGGYDKAKSIASQIARLDPPQGRLDEAKLANRRTQFDTAAEQLRRASKATSREVARLLDLARDLARRGQIAESDRAFQQAEKLLKEAPGV
jgi:tetratricopeptide (TPR) repeat protein